MKNLDIVTVIKNPSLDNERSNENYDDNSIEEGTKVRFNQTLRNDNKVSVGNDVYNLSEYDRIQFTDKTVNKYPNSGGELSKQRDLKRIDKIDNVKTQNFIKSTKIIKSTGNSGTTNLPPIGNSFKYIKIRSGISGSENVLCSSKWTDKVYINNIIYYYNNFSILKNDSLKSLGRIRIQLLMNNDTSSTRYNISKKDR